MRMNDDNDYENDPCDFAKADEALTGWVTDVTEALVKDNPVKPAPVEGDTLIIGVAGASRQWSFWHDTPRGRDEALAWVQLQCSFRKLYLVQIGSVTQLSVIPPVPARLAEEDEYLPWTPAREDDEYWGPGPV